MKIKLFCSIALLTLTASLASAQGVTRCGGPTNALYINWPTFGFDVCHTGYNPYENRLNVNNVKNLVLAWKYTLPGSSFPGDPVVVNGVVYFAGDYPNFDAVNANTGTLIWRFATAGGVQSAAAVVNDVVYVASNSTVYALKAATGELLWQQPVGRNVHSSPAVVDGVLYIGAQALGGVGNNIIALNASTGAPLWAYNVPGELNSSPAVVNGVVYIAGDSILYAVNAITGTLLWQSDQGVLVQSSPAVFHGVVYVGGAAVSALDAVTGSVLWKYTINPSFFGTSSLAIANGMVYIVTEFFVQNSGVSHLVALNASTGEPIWTGPPWQPDTSSPTVANGVVYVSIPTGGFLMLNAATGAQVGYTQGGGGYVDSPPVVNGVVYGACNAQDVGALCAFHLPSP